MRSTEINQDLFAAAVAGLPPGQLSIQRNDAAKLFSATGFPTARHEDWKYTSLAGAAELSNDWLATLAQESATTNAANTLTDAQLAPTQSINADWIIVHNGKVDAAALNQLSLPTGVSVSLIADDSDDVALATDSAMSAFNAALLTDGIRVRIANNVAVEKPLGFLMVDDDSGQVTQIRVVIELGENAALRIVECAGSTGADPKFTNSVTQLNLAKGAKLDFVRLQNHALDHLSTNRFIANINQDATLTHNSFDFGGDLTRNDIVAIIEGAGASVNLSGLYLAYGKQHIDNHTRVEHRVGPAVSHEEYRGILNDKSRCVFNGQAVVFEGADGTDANQANHNLLLSDQAEIDTKPELEIYADDVKCSHGATVGQLDEAALFYLRTRGLDTTEARHLLTQAFAANILHSLAVDEAHDFLKLQLDERVASLLGDKQP